MCSNNGGDLHQAARFPFRGLDYADQVRLPHRRLPFPVKVTDSAGNSFLWRCTIIFVEQDFIVSNDIQCFMLLLKITMYECLEFV